MNKKESLAFLQSCIESIHDATNETVALLQEAYELNCIEPIISSNFEFIPPIDIDNCLYKTNEMMQMKFSEAEYGVIGNSMQWNYNLGGISAKNEQSSANLPYAA